ncbi:MAG TPA: 16S rRNA (guanine(527)-N(7))-methyltransferase RsmG [Candidatus Solibacter sp.]|nr:16S rRNA (guanine(527)-N(7))-methyltransferase RsmG [Candidatus Solibacter sp.]
MHPGRIAELLHPFLLSDASLSTAQLEGISTYIDILLRWNARINLTAIRNAEEIVTRHFGESLFAAQHLFPKAVPGAAEAFLRPAERSDGTPSDAVSGGRVTLQGRVKRQEETGASAPTIADVGSGAGFPGIPIKLWAPQAHVTLIESNHKKSTFLREVVRALTLTDIDIKTTRVESTASLPASFDVVSLRAVERFATVLPVAATLVAPGGRLGLLMGASQLPEARAAIPTFAWSSPYPIPLSSSRILVIAQSKRSQPK